MVDNLRAHNETAMTLEQYRAAMVGRTRPLSDPGMSNDRAGKWRAEQAVQYESTTDRVLDLAQKLADARRDRATAAAALIAAMTPQPNKPVAGCGTSAGYTRHRRNGDDACTSCREAHALATRLHKANADARRGIAS